MDNDKETFETWNNIASLYEEKFMGLDLYNPTYDFMCSAIDKPNAKILEIGCGPANITRYLLSQRPDFSIFGIDIAPNMVSRAQQNNPGAHFEVMDCRHIHKLESKFDGIIGGFCLPYLSTTESIQLIANASDLLTEGGILYLSFVEGDPENSGFKVGSGGRVYFHYHLLDDLKAQLIRSNFHPLKTFEVQYKTSETGHDIHTILTAQKRMSCD